jgi:hypothetical protein
MVAHARAVTRSLFRPLVRGWQSLRRRREYRREIRAALASGRQPIIVFTMAKSASTSVEVSLMQLPEFAVWKAHRLHPPRIREYYKERRRRGEEERYRLVDDLGLALHDEIIRRRVPAQIVVLVREPIGRNFSAYFHILDVLWKCDDIYLADPGELAAGFMERGRHQVPIDWFDEEFKSIFGVDVFERPFPHDLGYVQLEAAPHRILILRSDLPDEQKASCLSEWLGRRSFNIVRMNEAGEKHYSMKYEAARRALQLPPDYVDAMLGSKYARHFFTPDELAGLRMKWSFPAGAASVQGDPT